MTSDHPHQLSTSLQPSVFLSVCNIFYLLSQLKTLQLQRESLSAMMQCGTVKKLFNINVNVTINMCHQMQELYEPFQSLTATSLVTCSDTNWSAISSSSSHRLTTTTTASDCQREQRELSYPVWYIEIGSTCLL